MMRNRGFGLVELLIVIAIIGILIGLVLAGVTISRDRSYDVRVKSGIRQLRIIAEKYSSENGDSFDGFAGCIGTPTATNCITQASADSVQALRLDIETANTASGSVSASSSETDFCVTAPLKSSSTSYVCADAGGETYEGASSTAPCASGTSCTFN